MRALLAVLVLVFAGCAAPNPPGGTSGIASSTERACPDHWHATFAIFLPGPAGPVRVDFFAPKVPNGVAYYDLATSRSGGDAKMTVALHMHQSGGESSSPAVDAAQWHMEADECTGVEK
ncbi:MAG: hypothetical protein ABR562_01495, partial [Thermoplasmatota archaeon]